MANTKSSKKDLRRIAKRRVRNQQTKTALKTYVKRVKQAASGGDVTAASEALTTAAKMLDKAVQRGIIHKNAAARRKSRAAKAANKAGTVVVAAPAAKPAKAAKAEAPAKSAKPAAKPAKAAAPKTEKAAPKTAKAKKTGA